MFMAANSLFGPSSSTGKGPNGDSSANNEQGSPLCATPASSIDIVPIESPNPEDIISDFDLSTHLNGMVGPFAREEMETIVFTNDEDFYFHCMPVKCTFTHCPEIEIKRNDQVAILPLNFDTVQWKEKVIASVSASECDSEECPYLLRTVIFPKELVAEAELNFPYQFVYIDETKGPIEKSRPFIFREAISEDFVEVTEDGDSFVMYKDYRSVLYDRVRQLLGKNTALENDRRIMEQTLNEKNAKIEELERTQGYIRKRYIDLYLQYKDLLSLKENIEQDLKMQGATLENLKTDHEILNAKWLNSSTTLESNREEILNLRRECAKMAETIAQISQEKIVVEKELAQLKEMNKDMVPKSDLLNALDNKKELKSQLSELYSKLANHDEEHNRLIKSLEAAHATITSYGHRDNDHLQSLKTLRDMVQVLEIQNEVIRADKEEISNQLVSANKFNNTLSETLANNSEEIDSLKKIINDTNDHVSEIEQQLAKKDDELVELKRCIVLLNSDVANIIDDRSFELKQQLAKKNDELKELKSYIVQYKSDVNRSQFHMIKENARLKNGLKDLQSTLETSEFRDLFTKRPEEKAQYSTKELDDLHCEKKDQVILTDAPEKCEKDVLLPGSSLDTLLSSFTPSSFKNLGGQKKGHIILTNPAEKREKDVLLSGLRPGMMIQSYSPSSSKDLDDAHCEKRDNIILTSPVEKCEKDVLLSGLKPGMFISPHTPSEYSARASLFKSFVSDSPSTDIPLLCPSLPESWSSWSSSSNNSVINSKKTSGPGSVSETIVCPECNKIFPKSDDLTGLRDHLENDHGQSICPICGMQFKKTGNTVAFESHVESHFMTSPYDEFD